VRVSWEYNSEVVTSTLPDMPLLQRTIDVELGESGPAGVLLHVGPQRGVREDIHAEDVDVCKQGGGKRAEITREARQGCGERQA
jgi:hypothetical protein